MFQWVMESPQYTTHMFGGQFHRVDGPAVIEPHMKQWIQNGLYHREDGPAIMNKETREVSSWLYGKCVGAGKMIDEETFNMYWGKE
jgi:hypothetical protein